MLSTRMAKMGAAISGFALLVACGADTDPGDGPELPFDRFILVTFGPANGGRSPTVKSVNSGLRWVDHNANTARKWRPFGGG